MMDNISSKLAAVHGADSSSMAQLAYESGVAFCDGWQLNRGISGVRNDWEVELAGNRVQQDDSSSSEQTHALQEYSTRARPASGMKRKAGSHVRNEGKSKEPSKVGELNSNILSLSFRSS